MGGNDQALRGLKDRFRGERCFVLGNGPSLKVHDLTHLREEFVFVSNWFVFHHEFPNLRHCFYCSTDPHHWNYGEGFHPELLEGLARHPNLLCFFEITARTAFARQRRLPSEIAHFVKVDFEKKVTEGQFSTNLPMETCWGHTVVIDLSLPLAFYLGFTTVYLLGCDCDYKLDASPDLSQGFFFDLSNLPQADLNHIYQQRDEFNAQQQLDKWERAYQVARDYFEKKGRKIFNAGKGGKLEVFERVEYQKLFGSTSDPSAR
ncbi:MAG: hypothetical protein ACE5JX_15045 [Acidobacteriota bacterium]